MSETRHIEVILECWGETNAGSSSPAAIPEGVFIETGSESGLQNCLALAECSSVASAMYVIAKSIERKWPWLRSKRLLDNCIEVSVSLKKENKFRDLMQKSTLETAVKYDFENLETNLEGLLEEVLYDKYGDEILMLARNLRIVSIKDPTSADEGSGSDGIVTGVLVKGTRDVKEFGNNLFVFDSGTKSSGGIVTSEYVACGGVVKGEKHGGSTLVAKGFRGADAAALAKIAKDDGVRVKIISDQFESTFECEFKPRTTIFEIRRQVLKQEGISGKLLILRRGRILPDHLTLAQAEADGSTVNWTAEIVN